MTDSSTAPATPAGAGALPEDLPPGALHRAAVYLGLTDDAPPLLRGSRAWWVRASVLAVVLLVMLALVAIGG